MNTEYFITDAELAAVTGVSEGHPVKESAAAAAASDIEDSSAIFDEDGVNISPSPLPGPHNYQYIPWGANNDMPYEVIRKIREDEVMSQNKLFNVLTNYGRGLQLTDPATGEETEDSNILNWIMSNALSTYQLEQSTDMKHFYFAVSVIILSRDGKKIVCLRHREACYCRFEAADSKGRIRHIFYGNWRKGSLKEEDVEVLPLLDFYDPLGDLRRRMGLEKYQDGSKRPTPQTYKYAILTRFPTVGFQYYPIPYYAAIFRGDWYDIKRMIGAGKKALMRNQPVVKYHVEISRDYFDRIVLRESDPEKRKARVLQEKEKIRDFITGAENSGKVWFSTFLQTPDGKEVHDIRINRIETSKAGGEWSEDIEEASNITCYGDNIHPNLVGATPGKSQSNNSGSDKRELFTMKQALEKAWHDIMMTPLQVCIRYNGWNVRPEVPMLMLTTLDQHTDAKETKV